MSGIQIIGLSVALFLFIFLRMIIHASRLGDKIAEDNEIKYRKVNAEALEKGSAWAVAELQVTSDKVRVSALKYAIMEMQWRLDDN